MKSIGEPVSIPYFLEKSAIETGFIDIYTVEAGKTLRVTKIRVQFPSGTGGELEVALYYGDLKVAPETASYKGDDARFEDDIDVAYFSGDPVRLWYNCTIANARKANIKLDGVLE